ncbi:permease-like cell division protein FtsX [Ferrovum sp.]|jgi:cell division transport system permease protein|uniref:cell division protein FtsX n=1 Tax=Ferrovum sp. TaxID=2609467 RepID=UPI00263A1067|nr:permease-like cell division protein FtsX [Ferrovum sp.]
MRIWLHHHAHAFRQARSFILGQPLRHAVSLLFLGMLVALSLGTGFFWQKINHWARDTLPEPTLTLFMTDQANETQTHALWDSLAANPQIRAFEYISPAQALDSLRRAPDLAPALKALDRNPLPGAFVLHLRDPSPARFNQLEQAFSHREGVAQIRSDRLWAERLETVSTLAESILGFCALLFAVLSFLFIAYQTHQQALRQREALSLLNLLGASLCYQRRPFAYYGALLGAGAGLLAWAGIFWVLTLIIPFTHALGALFQITLDLPPPDLRDGGALVLISTLGGIFASLVGQRNSRAD